MHIRIIRNIPTPLYLYNRLDMPHNALKIELGKYWEIFISRRLAESLWKSPAQPPNLLKNKSFVKLLKEGEIIPNWYGFAYYNFDSDDAAYMPIPLNLIRAGWEWFRFNVLRNIKFDWPRNITLKERQQLKEKRNNILTIEAVMAACHRHLMFECERDLREVSLSLREELRWPKKELAVTG